MKRKATILIPDISGYTEFFSRTDLDFSTEILGELLRELISVADDSYRVAEIEGDAILFYILDRKLSADELVSYCLKAYRHFHQYLGCVVKRVQDPVARKAAEVLTVKFIAHYGLIGELSIGNFTKPVGLELIKAHRLLKNNIPHTSYILLTDTFANSNEISGCNEGELADLCWQPGEEEYPVVGKLKYQYAPLSDALMP